MNEATFPGGFTVLMAVYHRDSPALFRMAVESVFSNTLQPDAFILVVDGPVSGALEQEIESLKGSFAITVHCLDENIGLAGALNEGLALVATEWILRADADDYNLQHRFSAMAKALAASADRLDLFGSAIVEVDHDGTKLATRRTVENHKDIRKFASKRNPFNHMTVAMRAALARSAGGYPDIFLKEDYALWASLLKLNARTANLPDVLVRATTGRAMYGRRGGLKYALSEIRLQRHLVRCNLKGYSAALVDGLMRSAVFLIPSSLRAFVYTRFLRR
ncbi:hypothetical protein B9057_15065 (plasmid) [Aestuarium zhoushanense]|nr:hypothetical protein B9057_15065 [Aestuarium zhoushanense]